VDGEEWEGEGEVMWPFKKKHVHSFGKWEEIERGNIETVAQIVAGVEFPHEPRTTGFYISQLRRCEECGFSEATMQRMRL
jgi:hypothetical protein